MERLMGRSQKMQKHGIGKLQMNQYILINVLSLHSQQHKFYEH